MENIKITRQSAQIFIGSMLTLGGSFLLVKSIASTNFFLRNFTNFTKAYPSLKQLMKNPGKMENVLLTNLKCISSPDLFKEHMAYIDKNTQRRTNEFCFQQIATDFMAELVFNNEKYDIYCDCSSFHPFVSRSLLINNLDLYKKADKKRILTMVSYGSLKYDKEKKRFHFEGHCFATAHDQIAWCFTHLLRLKYLHFFMSGIILSIGICLLNERFKQLDWKKIVQQIV